MPCVAVVQWLHVKIRRDMASGGRSPVSELSVTIIWFKRIVFRYPCGNGKIEQLRCKAETGGSGQNSHVSSFIAWHLLGAGKRTGQWLEVKLFAGAAVYLVCR